MIAETVVLYEITYIALGSRKPRSTILMERVPIEVRATSALDVVGTIEGTKWHSDGERLYYNWSHANPNRTLTDALTSTTDTNPITPWHAVNVKGEPVDANTAPAFLRIKEMIASGRSETIGRANDLAQTLILADGDLLVESDGPLLSFSPFPLQDAGARKRQITVSNRPVRQDAGIYGASFSIHDIENSRWMLQAAGLKLISPITFDIANLAAFPEHAAADGMRASARYFMFEGMPNRTLANIAPTHLEAHLELTDPERDVDDLDRLAEILALSISEKSEFNYDTRNAKNVRELAIQVELAVQTWEFEKRRLYPAPALVL